MAHSERLAHVLHPLLVASAVSISATLASRYAPSEHAASLVGLIFLASTYWLCLREGEPRNFGLSCGGVFERAPLEPSRLLRELGGALGWTAISSLAVFPLFALGFTLWYEPRLPFSPARALAELSAGSSMGLVDLVLGHLLVVAVPEEAFFRGYLQSSLDERWGTPRKWCGARIGHGLWVTSAVFALGHLAATPHPARLAVFFPSLLFGFLRARTGGVGAPILFHATCNLVAAFLAAGYGFAVTAE